MENPQNSLKIDCQVSAVPINRYLIKTKTIKYTRSQEVESVKVQHFIQWKNIFSDFGNLIVHPIRTYPAVSYSLASMLLFLRGQEHMAQLVFVMGALTRDTAVEANNSGSFSVTVASNSNRIMYMGFGHYQGGDNISASAYNSVSLTEVKAQAGSFGERCGIWGLVAPSTGTNTFTVTGNDSWTGYGVVSIYDADQTLSANTNGASGDSGGSSTSVTTTVDNAWVFCAIGAEPGITMTTSGGVEDMNEQGDVFQNAEAHHVNKATAGAQSMSFSLGYGARWNIAACEIKPAGGGGGAAVRHPMSLTGAGR